MGRSLAMVVAVVALVVVISLIDHDRGADPTVDQALASAPEETTGVSAPSDPATFGGSSITKCIGALSADPPKNTPFPGLTDQGVAEISKRVEGLRHLQFSGPVDASFLTNEQLDQRIAELSGGKRVRSSTAEEGAALQLLGAIPPGSDLFALQTKALEDQVVGLYDPKSKQLLVAKSGDPGAIEEITLSHELEHALADDALGLPDSTRDAAAAGDAALASQALVEGDATLTMELYALRYVSLSDQLDLADDPEIASGDKGLDELPDFLQRELLFPYDAGLQFVCDQYLKGGWKAVDAAYDDPPSSTAELLGLTDEDPRDPSPTGKIADGWHPVLRDQLGTAALAWLFAAPGGDPDKALPEPRDAVGGWNGDELTLWQRDGGKPGDAGDSALGLSILDDGTGSLCGATIAWYSAAFPDSTLGKDGETTTFEGPDQDAAIVCDGKSIRLGIAPDPELAATLAQAP